MASAFEITLTIITIVTVQLDSPGISAKQVNFIDLENHAGDHTQTREKNWSSVITILNRYFCGDTLPTRKLCKLLWFSFSKPKNSSTLNWTSFSCSVTSMKPMPTLWALKNKQKWYNLDIYIIECYSQQCNVYWFFLYFLQHCSCWYYRYMLIFGAKQNHVILLR